MKKFFRTFGAGLLLFILLVGCDRLRQEDYDLLEPGMSYKEVVEILGSPEECSNVMGVKSCTWGDERKNIRVGFMGDSAVVFSATGLN